MQPQHCKTVLLSMGNNFERELSVGDLQSLGLSEHRQVIDTVYASAVAEYRVQHQLRLLQAQWQNLEFKLAKHIPDSLYKENARRFNICRFLCNLIY